MKSLTSIHCDNCAFKKDSAFSNLCPQLLDELHRSKTPNVFKRGQIIFYEGNVSTGTYCVQSGKIKLFKTDENGHQQILHLAAPGDLIGYRSLFTNQPHSVTAEALEDATLCFIDKQMFLNIFQHDAPTASRIASLMGEQLRKSGELSLHLAYRHIRERLAETLLLLGTRFGKENGGKCHLDLSLSRRDIANLIGTSEESVVRMLSELKDDGFINVNRRNITLLDKNKLADLANITS